MDGRASRRVAGAPPPPPPPLPEHIEALRKEWEDSVDALAQAKAPAPEPHANDSPQQNSCSSKSDGDAQAEAEADWEFLQESERDEAAAAGERLHRESVAREKLISAFSASYNRKQMSSQASAAMILKRTSSGAGSNLAPNEDVMRRILGSESSSVSSDGSQWLAPSPTLSLRDRIVGFMAGETDTESLNRAHLKRYKNALQMEMQSTRSALQHHLNRKTELELDFQGHEKQLQKWGLTALLPHLRMQALLRISRAQLLAEMASHALRMLELRSEEAHVLSQDPSINVDPLFFLAPEALLSNDISLGIMRTRLTWLDRCCQDASKRFKRLLPELESKTREQRQRSLVKVVEVYGDLLEDFWTDGSWEEYLIWQEKRDGRLRLCESHFAAFIGDEREREGRLFRRWAALADIISYREQPKASVNNARPRTHYVPVQAMSPRSIREFSKYFAFSVLANQYAIPENLKDSLLALTLSTVFRKLHTFVFDYKTEALREQDCRWRRKCRRLRRMSPEKYDVPSQFLAPELLHQEIQGSNMLSTVVCATLRTQTNDCDEPDVQDIRTASSSSATANGGNLFRSISDAPTVETPNTAIPRGIPLSQGREVIKIQSAYVARCRSRGARVRGPCSFFSKSCAAFERLCSCVTPYEIVHCILITIKWLHFDACEATGKAESLGADDIFPLLVLILVNSDVPCMHLVLQYLRSFGAIDGAGEAAYYVTCIEAMVAFIMKFEVPEEIDQACLAEDEEDGSVRKTIHTNFDEDIEDLLSPISETMDNELAMRSLGQWLRDQQTMEDTISVLQQEGWMI